MLTYKDLRLTCVSAYKDVHNIMYQLTRMCKILCVSLQGCSQYCLCVREDFKKKLIVPDPSPPFFLKSSLSLQDCAQYCVSAYNDAHNIVCQLTKSLISVSDIPH